MAVTVLYIFVYIIEAIILGWYCNHLFNPKYSKKVECLFIAMGYACLFFISLAMIFYINIALFILINFILIFFLYDAKWHSALFNALTLTCIMTLSEVVILQLKSLISIDFLYSDSHIVYLCVVALLCKITYFIMLRLIVVFMYGSKERNDSFSIPTALLNVIPLISLYIISTLVAIILSKNMPGHFKYMLFSCTFLLLGINILIFYIYHYTIDKSSESTQLQIQLQKEYDMTEYYKSLFNQNENQQILIHDIKNHLQTINRLNDENNREKISRYLESLLNSSDLKDSVHVSDNEVLNSILCHYMKICRDKHISFKVDIRKKLLQNLKYEELTSLFCNLLDNAVEACSDIPDSYIEMSVSFEPNSSLTVINIINTCRVVPTFDKNGRPVTTKKGSKNHGFGVKSINRVIDRYNGNIKMYFDESKMAFHTIITIKES